MTLPRPLLLSALALITACSGDASSSDGSASASATVTAGLSTSTSSSSSSSSGASASSTDGASSTATDGTSTAAASSTGGVESTGTTAADTSAGGSTTGVMCDPVEDICCLMEGQIPPHKLLDDFLAAYPPANMPKTVAEVQAFAPMVDGHTMAWSDENVADELVDANNGGVIEANVAAGRELSRQAAVMALPAGAVVLDTREDPVIIEDLGTPAPCIGVGWAWGSILFEAVDTSIGELVYLYIGFCSDVDVERFFYSDRAVEVCAPVPG